MRKQKIIVCGAAGYLGSHMCKLLAEDGHELFVIDNLSTGHREAVQWAKLYVGDLCDEPFLERVFDEVGPDIVYDFAARSVVAESAIDPAAYYRTNVVGSFNLLECLRKRPGVPLIFSSTAAVYGSPVQDTMDEAHPTMPINTYGRTKLVIENALRDYWDAYRVPSVSFRYFNAAGADAGGTIGESHFPETHLIPNVLKSLFEDGPGLTVYGSDYKTRDGTCVRDYVHVEDLCRAHRLGMQQLLHEPGCYNINLGNGHGFTVREVIAAATEVTGRKVRYQMSDKRIGDPACLVANASLAQRLLGWQPVYRSLESILETAWRWHLAPRY